MGQPAHFADRRVARLEASILGIIQTALADVVTPLSAAIDAFVAMITEAADPESEAETDEELLEVAEEASYEGLTLIEEALVDATVRALLVDTPLNDLSAVAIPSEATPGTDA
ncbi:hypothetical protein H5410_052951 [Solanum commersonii]|uniref:Polyprotein protein n=1 Tax=Solanum commersonii TaxID=4109 RepID=A0A9J5X4V8_SOLCO|nr:hypothetical protein H5410_052951 [Solanum commersonii]